MTSYHPFNTLIEQPRLLGVVSKQTSEYGLSFSSYNSDNPPRLIDLSSRGSSSLAPWDAWQKKQFLATLRQKAPKAVILNVV